MLNVFLINRDWFIYGHNSIAKLQPLSQIMKKLYKKGE